MAPSLVPVAGPSKKAAEPTTKFRVNEKCLARWSDSRKFKATVKTILPNGKLQGQSVHLRVRSFAFGSTTTTSTLHCSNNNRALTSGLCICCSSRRFRKQNIDTLFHVHDRVSPAGLYEVLFDDGFLKTVKLKHMSKLKGPRTPVKKGSTLPVVSLVDGEEWYCQWVDDCPLGLTVPLEGVPAKVRVIQVDDSRLPVDWTKYFMERLHGGTKWDILVIAPCGRRFRGRQDVKAFIEETASHALNIADFDFAMHKKRAKEKGVYTYTDAYRKFLKAIYPSMAEIDTIPPTPADVQELYVAQQPPMLLEPLPEVVTRDWLMVDGMKVQIIDNLLRCPEEGCLKNFRKENLLKIHIKHYHEAMAKKITAAPTMTDLAYIRTQSLVVEDTPVVRPPVDHSVISPPKGVRRPLEKPKASLDASTDTLAAIDVDEEEENLIQTQQPMHTTQPSILEQALNSGAASVIKTEDGQERVYPKATPITGAHNKRKNIRKTNECKFC